MKPIKPMPDIDPDLPTPLREGFEALDARMPDSPHQAELRTAFLRAAEAYRISDRRSVRLDPSAATEPQKGSLMKRRQWVRTIVIAAIVLAIGWLAAPALISIAQDILDFFTPDTDDQRTTDVYYNGFYPRGTPHPTPERPFSLTLEDAMAQVEGAIYLPTFIPEAYHFEGAQVFYQTRGSFVALNYKCGMIWAFSITQWPLGESTPEPESVGVSATIVPVDINGVTGQYVRGYWDINASATHDLVGPGTPVAVDSVWVNEGNWHHLSWAADGTRFSIQTSGGTMGSEAAPGRCTLTQDDLTAIARGMQTQP